MATVISQKTLTSSNPAVYGQVDYSSYRSGNYMVYTISVSAWITSSGGWRNNRWACQLKVNGEWVWDNQTIKAKTSGAIGTGWKTATTGELWYATNSGSISVWVKYADTGGSSSWSIHENWGEYTGSLPVTAPSAPSAPSSCSIPSAVAPDKSASISWPAASGGTNGVSGYQLAWSKDGGSNYNYVDVSGTSYSLDLGNNGFVNGSVLKCAIRSYSTVNGTRYYSGWTYSGSTTTNFVAPSVPSSITIPSSAAPDKTISISWGTSSGGSNGVGGYRLEYSKDGGSTWTGVDVSGTSYSLNLNSAGFVQGSVLKARVRAYTVGQSNRYYSGYKTSGTITTNFVAPGAPTGLGLTYAEEEPIPSATFTATWTAPQNGGTNGVKGYKIQWLKNGSNYGSEQTVTTTSKSITISEDDFQPGDKISFKVRAYTTGQSNNYYSGYTTSGSITIVSDKYIFVSQNGGAFTKYKMYISVNGAAFKEVKKEKFRVI